MLLAEFDRLNGATELTELEFVERERTPEQIVELGIQLHHAGLSLSNTKQNLDILGVKRSRTAIHNWVRKADLQPTSDGAPNQISVDETVTRINDQRHLLYAGVDPETNEFLNVRLFQTRDTLLTVLFLRELREKQRVEQATVLVDGAQYLTAALERLGLRFQISRHGNRNSIERIFREVKRRTSSFSNTLSNVESPTAESWFQAFSVWWNQC